AIDILFNAQSVCSVWRKVSKEPSLFRSIEISLDMQNRWRHAGLFEDRLYQLEKLAKEAADRRSCKRIIERSCGQLVKFSMERFDSDELLAYIANKSGSLRCLRLVSCDKVEGGCIVNMAKKLSCWRNLKYATVLSQRICLKLLGKHCLS
ncbi:hypothetical protein MKW92_002985, partial [Papaver armeniacum]